MNEARQKAVESAKREARASLSQARVHLEAKNAELAEASLERAGRWFARAFMLETFPAADDYFDNDSFTFRPRAEVKS